MHSAMLPLPWPSTLRAKVAKPVFTLVIGFPSLHAAATASSVKPWSVILRSVWFRSWRLRDWHINLPASARRGKPNLVVWGIQFLPVWRQKAPVWQMEYDVKKGVLCRRKYVVVLKHCILSVKLYTSCALRINCPLRRYALLFLWQL